MRNVILRFATILAIFGLMAANASLAIAESNKTDTRAMGWGGSLRIGGSFFTEDLEKSDFAPTINGQIFYNIPGPIGAMGHDWNLGINFDFAKHELDNTDAEFRSFSLIPYLEVRTRYEQWAPYVAFGLGMNFSAVTKEPSGVDIDVKNSLAMRAGVGADWFLTKNLAFNTEAAFKLNEPNAQGSIGGTKVGSGSIDANVVQVLAGLRYYFSY